MSTKNWYIGLLVILAMGSVAGAARAAYWTPWVSDENGGPATYCTSWNEAARGVGCSGSYCDNMRLYCDTLPSGITLDPSYDTWTSYFSEEWNGITKTVFDSDDWFPYFQSNFQVCLPYGRAGIMSGIRCSGSYCDNISLECDRPEHTSDGSTAIFSSCSWSAQYSDENGSIDFGPNHWVAGAECFNSYCDRLSYYVCSF